MDSPKYYALMGTEDFVDNEGLPRVLEKEQANAYSHNGKYYVQVSGLVGTLRNVANPNSDAIPIRPSTGQGWIFQETNKDSFMSYLYYLKTKHEMYYHTARRAMV